MRGHRAFSSEVVWIRRYEEWPEEGELVIVKIKEIYPNSTLVTLEEYPGKKGMIHISEISTRWIKNIRDFVKIGQKWVAKVLSVDKERKHVALSIKRVSQSAKREKQKQWNNEKKAEKWLQMIAKELGRNPARMYEDVGFLLQKRFDLMYNAFEVAQKEGKDALVKEGIPEEWAERIERFAREYIKEKEVQLKKVVEIRSYDSNGLEAIKEAVEKALTPNILVKYINSPRYQVVVKGQDFKTCQKELERFINDVDTALRPKNGFCRLAEA